MVKQAHKRRASISPTKKLKLKKHKWIKKKFHELPIEVLAGIFDLIPREELTSVAVQCRTFRSAIGIIVRQDLCKYKKRLNGTINNLINALRCGGITTSESSRWDMIQKIAYTRIMRIKLLTLEAIIGNYRHNKELWNMLLLQLLDVIHEQEGLLTSVTEFPYFIKDIRPRYVNSNMRRLSRLLQRYFIDIDPTLQESHIDEPYSVQIFNLLNTCQSANLKVVTFQPSKSDILYVSMFFEIRGLGKRFEIERFNEYSDETKPTSKKLSDLKIYLYNVLEHENSEFLFYQTERILNLETHLDSPYLGALNNEVLEYLETAYDTFLCNTYNEINSKTTMFNYNDTKIYRHEISRQQEIRSCVSNVILNLKFCCHHRHLAECTMSNIDDISKYTLEENDSVGKTISEYLSLVDSLLDQKNQAKNRTADTNAMDLDILISHNEHQKSIIVVMKRLGVKMNKSGVTFNVINDEILSRFDDLLCECHANGSRCDDKSIFLPL